MDSVSPTQIPQATQDALLRAAVAGSQPLLVFCASGKLAWCNQACSRLNLTHEFRLGQTFSELVGSPGACLESATGDGINFAIGDGEVQTWIEARAERMPDGATVVRLRDITAAVREYESICQERDISNEILDQVGTLVLNTDQEGRVSVYNRAAERAYGFAASEVLGKYYWDALVPPEKREFSRTTFQSNTAEDYPAVYESTWKRKDGTDICVRFTDTCVTFPDGSIRFVIGTGEDVTHQRLVETQLKESQKRYQIAIEGASEGLWDLDVESGVCFYSPRYKELLGLEEDAALEDSKVFQSLIHPEDLPQAMEALRSLQDGEVDTYRVTFRVRSGENDWKWLESRATAIRDETGATTRIVGSHVDRTREQETQNRLASTARLLDESQAIADIGSWERLPKSEEVFWSDHTYEVFDFDPKLGVPSLGKFLSRVHPTERADFELMMHNLYSDGIAFDRVVQFEDTAKEYRFLRMRGSTFQQSGDEKPTAFGVVQNITTEKRSELALKDGQQLIERAQEIAKVGSWSIDLRNREVQWSEQMFKLFELTPFEKGATIEDVGNAVASRADRRQLLKFIRTVEKLGEVDIDFSFQTGAGETRYLKIFGEPVLDGAGATTGMAGFVQDVTEQVFTELDLVQAREQALESVRLKSDFLANMSHEIRTPMNGVIGMTRILLDSPLSDEQVEVAELIRNSAEGLLQIVNDILDFSKVESGRLSLDAVPTDLVTLCEEVVQLFAPRACQKKVKLASWSSLGSTVKVIADDVRIRQILTNLVGNALKFTHSGIVEISVHKVDTGYAIEVRDTGIGIPPERQTAIFESFTQADGSITREFGGTGLGLAIVRQLTGLMQGRCEVESTVGLGSTFRVILPLEPLESTFEQESVSLKGIRFRLDLHTKPRNEVAARIIGSLGGEIVESGETWLFTDIPGAKHPRAVLWKPLGSDVSTNREQEIVGPLTSQSLLRALGEAQTLRKEGVEIHQAIYSGKVLLAEDNPVNQRVALHLLERAGLTVDVADNGEIAVQKVQAGRYDLVFMDIQMPIMDGLTATQRIREWEKDRDIHVPIIAMTAHAMDGDREKCLRVGMDGYLTKPINKANLMEEIHTYMQEKPELQVIDRQYLADMSGGDVEFVQELLLTFADCAPPLMSSIEEGFQNSDPVAVLTAAHTLKGASRSIGSAAFADVCEQIEKAARLNDLSKCASLRLSLIENFNDLIAACKAA